MADAVAPKPDRSLAIDAIKGVGILEVVAHHALGQGARTFAHKGDWAWTAMRSVAWATNFAIPLFLLLSAMLLAGSLLRKPETGRFALRRIARSLWPYLAWSLIYWLLRWRNDPRTFENPNKLAIELLTGKAAYHLYFMVILFQLTIAVPFVVAVLRRRRLGFTAIVLLSAVLQGVAFFANRVPALTVKSPGSLLTWYVPSLLIGVWIALNPEAWREAWRRGWPAMVAAAVVSGAAFTVFSVRSDLGIPPNSLVYNSLSVVFRVAASLALLGAGEPLARLSLSPLFAPLRRDSPPVSLRPGLLSRLKGPRSGAALTNLNPGSILAALGRYSLPIYLVHPAFLSLLKGPRISAVLAKLPFPVLWTIVVVTAVSYGFAWLTSLSRVDLVLFGQRLPRRTPRPSIA